jgi:hypothetical protein
MQVKWRIHRIYRIYRLIIGVIGALGQISAPTFCYSLDLV